MALSLNAKICQAKQLTQLRDNEKGMQDKKERNKDMESKIEERNKELDRQQSFSRSDNVFYCIPKVRVGVEDCVHTLVGLINLHSCYDRVWSEEDIDRPFVWEGLLLQKLSQLL